MKNYNNSKQTDVSGVVEWVSKMYKSCTNEGQVRVTDNVYITFKKQLQVSKGNEYAQAVDDVIEGVRNRATLEFDSIAQRNFVNSEVDFNVDAW